MTDFVSVFGDLLGLIFVWFGTILAGMMTAQIIKLLPLVLGLAGTLKFHDGFPMDSYNGLRTTLKLAPLRFLLLPFRYSGKMIAEGDLLGLVAGWIAIPIFMFAFLYGVWVGFWYVSLLRMLIPPFRVVYNIN
jgi:hypothetical protein